MNQWWLLAVWLVPLLLAPMSWMRGGRWLPSIAALPALLTAIATTDGVRLELDWLFLGAQFAVERLDRPFLLAAGSLWAIAGLYSASYLHKDKNSARFGMFFMLAMSGNMALIVGQDIYSYYFGFSLMGFAAYGLIIHDASQAARRAGRVYLTMTLIAEFMLFGAFILMFDGTGLPTPTALAMSGGFELALLFVALGIKAGVIGLHMWLPLAHPAAPVPASAVLSGAMIKAAFIGWMRFVPFGTDALPVFGAVLIASGLAGILFATLIGVVQRDAKVILAYSSISSMSVLVAALGVAALVPEASQLILIAVATYAVHHGLAKGALFLGVGVNSHLTRYWSWGLLVPMCALIGLPFTSGAAAKSELKLSFESVSPEFAGILYLGLTAATVVSVVLMTRFGYVMYQRAPRDQAVVNGLIPAWILALSASAGAGIVLGPVAVAAGDMLWILFALAGCAAVLLLSRHTNGLQRLVGRGPTNAGLRNIGRLFDAIPRRLMSISRPGAMPKLLRSPVARIDRLGGILNDPALSAVLWLGLITALFIAAMYA